MEANLRKAVLIAAALLAPPALAFGQAATTPPPAQPAQRQAPAQPQRMNHIEPANQLERTFIAALTDEAQRGPFRQQFMNAQVAVVMTGAAADAQPLQVPIGQKMYAAVFTSADRVSGVFGPNAARRVLTGREALTLLRGKNVAVNPQLSPMLTLDAADVTTWLATPAAP